MIHATLFKAYVSLGYKKHSEGLCNGVSIRWVEAKMLDQEPAFFERIDKIVDQEKNLKSLIETATNKEEKDRTEEDKKLIDIKAFFDCVTIIHYSGLYYSYLLNQDSDIEEAPRINSFSSIASSKLIFDQGGLNEVFKEINAYSEVELKNYFDKLTLILNKLPLQPKEIIAIRLANKCHYIALTFSKDAQWSGMDINQYPSKEFGNDTLGIAQYLIKGFTRVHPEEDAASIGLYIHVLTLAKPHWLPLLLSELYGLKQKPVYEKQLSETTLASILYLAVYINDLALIKELAKLPNVNFKITVNNGATLGFVAAQEGYENVINALATLGVDFNKPTQDGATPTFVAAEHNHVKVLKALAKLPNIDFNIPTKSGETPTFVAASMGFVEPLKVLATCGADLNKAQNDGGTPAIIAAYEAHAEVIKVLASYGADLNKPRNDGATPAIMAAYKAHAEVIKVLAKHPVDFNKATLDGKTPAYFAAQEGHVEVTKALAAIPNVDFNKPSLIGATPTHIAAQQRHVNVIKVLATIPNVDFNKRTQIGETPAHIAARLGYADVIEALKKHQRESHAQNQYSFFTPLQSIEYIYEMASNSFSWFSGPRPT